MCSPVAPEVFTNDDSEAASSSSFSLWATATVLRYALRLSSGEAVRLRVHPRERSVQSKVGDLAEPEQRFEVVAEQELLVAAVRMHLHRLDEARGLLVVLLVEVVALDAVRVAGERERAVT